MNPESEEPMVWVLRQGAQLLATIEVLDQDFPWNYGRVYPTASFEPFRHCFVPQPSPEVAKVTRDHLRDQGITLAPRGGAPVRVFGLIVDGEDARFQFS